MVRISLIGIFITMFTLTLASNKQCRGTCPIGNPNNDVYLLPHEDCTKYCKCDIDIPVVMQCPLKLYFNPMFGVCDRQSQCECVNADSNEFDDSVLTLANSSSSTIQNESSTLADTSGCMGYCPSWVVDNVVHLAHKDCTKFCKCDADVPVVMQCPPSLHWNPKLNVCDRPSHAHCTGFIETSY